MDQDTAFQARLPLTGKLYAPFKGYVSTGAMRLGRQFGAEEDGDCRGVDPDAQSVQWQAESKVAPAMLAQT